MRENSTGFEPFNDSHAIVMASISVQFAGMLDEAAWLALRPRILETVRRLGGGTPQPFYGLNLTFDQSRISVGLNLPSTALGELQGLIFTLMDDDDQIVERLIAAKDALVIQSSSYIRWNSFFSRAQDFVGHLFDGYNEVLPVAHARCEYWDRFDHRGATDPEVTTVIRSDGGFVAPASVKSSGTWHSHCGFSEQLTSGRSRVSSVRVDYADAHRREGAPGKSIFIHTMMQDTFTLDNEANASDKAVKMEAIFETLSEQHDQLKVVLGRTITDSAARRIKLGDNHVS